MRFRRLPPEGIAAHTRDQWSFAVHRLTEGVNDPAKPRIVRIDHRLCVGNLGTTANTNALQGTKWHGLNTAIFKADNFAADAGLATCFKENPITNRQGPLNAANFHHHPKYAGNPAVKSKGRNLVNLGGSIMQR